MAKRREARIDDLTEGIADYLLCGHWYADLSGDAQPSAEAARRLWLSHRDTLLASYEPPRYCPDRPPWGHYLFELLPTHGSRGGADPSDPASGYFADGRDAELWTEYLARVGAK
jgi:hypothetical protein